MSLILTYLDRLESSELVEKLFSKLFRHGKDRELNNFFQTIFKMCL